MKRPKYKAELKASDGRTFTARVWDVKDESSARDVAIQFVKAKFGVQWATIKSIETIN